MIKIVAIGDIHGRWDTVWHMLRAASAADSDDQPTQPVKEGRLQVVLIGDLVHYKDQKGYVNATGIADYDATNPEHLVKAAKVQIDGLEHLKRYFDAANGNVTVILGNHDDSALNHEYSLQTRQGTIHDEFDESKGGYPIPETLHEWIANFPREKKFYNVHFSHAGPLPGMQYFDAMFYNDSDTKTWWQKKPWLVTQARHRFGVYGHTPTDGIYLDSEDKFAMIDALAKKQYLEMIVSEDRLDYHIMQIGG